MSDYGAFNNPEHDAIVAAALRLKVDAADLLQCVQAVSISRRGSNEWSEHDLLIAESCLATFTRCVLRANDRLTGTTFEQRHPGQLDPTRVQRDTAQPSEGDTDV